MQHINFRKHVQRLLEMNQNVLPFTPGAILNVTPFIFEVSLPSIMKNLRLISDHAIHFIRRGMLLVITSILFY